MDQKQSFSPTNPTNNHAASVPICVTIAGSDSSGGAGIQADLKAFSALGVYGASVIAAITVQNTRTVSAVHDVPPQIVAGQIDAVFSDLDVAAVKIGMVSVPETIEAIAHGLAHFSGPIVLDPVMVAKSGDRLLSETAISSLRKKLLPLATLLTPNRPEAACLIDTGTAGSDAEAEEQGRALLDLGAKAVLMKGGHAEGAICTDLLIRRDRPTLRIEAPRILTDNTHGTGCTLSSAIAAGLSRNLSLETALAQAHAYLQGAIRAADSLKVGQGHGPVHHFHALWKQAEREAI
ncbi:MULTISPECIES: bifunctional hydroxymethylpyrimidine kinase/phosphomethylpyrimidine kinase [Brucella]|uniref:bifunctional hydroxymethylpyrimidine kinase/phosphomethylpyrimidine kinase n=1 Tax=Brucella abortus TaxID=235 RepID=UPI0002CEB6D2|nr:bifunctional hydroxymethylpyrimidine kinase/phosphomethylpyrimidine kinase [Brucella abortus]ERM86847.1 phosphomethylpyrimidine kinase [Brucella abortus 82]ERT85818.1 phosphomethylpyrimidine kinase [Brucella abortus 90-12178]ERT99064.1 phosphomethylpyrimidine kinase [Brucella abortus 99-9971-135]AKO27317.1 Hydroxymethylpyrimidine phosphate kinase ThiD [Brucella abortus]ASU72453.1 bifunctional hydroxymethylpyrimidine kinase/phosphomethylpyrimidine kinase [Brucella abortus]